MSASPRSRRVYSIPAHAPFMATLAQALADGTLFPNLDLAGDPLLLADTTIFVPTQRSVPLLRQELLSAFGRRATLLPHIRALGHFDEADILDNEPPDPALAESGLADLPPQINPIDRRLALTRLALHWQRALVAAVGGDDGVAVVIPASPADACWLAGDLERLLDGAAAEGVAWRDLAGLVPEDLARYWQLTLEFLRIVTDYWPAHLADNQVIDGAERRNRLLDAYRQRLQASPPDAPVIVAGSTGTLPATARLMTAISELDHGAIILPGLDTTLDDEAWNLLEIADEAAADPIAGHSQFGLARLLQTMAVVRDEVEILGDASGALANRERLVSEAMRPAMTTEYWPQTVGAFATGDIAAALADIGHLEARHEREEALAIAVALRQACEDGKQAALVTPDRGLARRVSSELRRWEIVVDDAAGTPLPLTPAGTLARLTLQLTLTDLAPVTLLSLLKHPRTLLGRPAVEIRSLARKLERLVLRGPRPGTTLAAIRKAVIERRGEPGVGDADVEAAVSLIDILTAALAPLDALSTKDAVPVSELGTALGAALQLIGAPQDSAQTDHLFDYEDGRILHGIIDQIAGSQRVDLTIAPRAFPAMFDALIADRPVRGPGQARTDIHIWGTLESRLQDPDLIILGGLNEGVWPSETRLDPWLSRPMRQGIGLASPERRIGLSAHDFTQAMGRRQVLLTRSQRAGGSPTVASRWLQRLFAVSGKDQVTAMTERGAVYRDLARFLDRPETAKPRPVARPDPRPPVEARPTRASVTEVETWIRDAYAVYARRILRLEPLDPIDADPGAAERGILIHHILGTFCGNWTGAYDERALEALLDLGRREFAKFAAFAEIQAIWWPRFERIARWFIFEFEGPRRANIAELASEIDGRLDLMVDGTPFTLTGRADRIERHPGGGLSIHDYKTGSVPSEKQVASNLAPQLPLEAAMAAAGAFQDFDAGATDTLAYIHLTGGVPPARIEKRAKAMPVMDLAADAQDRLEALIRYYRDGRTGYLSRGRVERAGDMDGAYDHLARTREWSVGGPEEDG